MEILYLLIPISIVLVFLIGAIFWWALNNRQFDELDEAANHIFLEDDLIHTPDVTPPSTDASNSKNPTQ